MFYRNVVEQTTGPESLTHVFQPTRTIFKLVQDMIGKNLLTEFHGDRTINMAIRVLTTKNAPPPWQTYIIWTNLLTKFHEDRKMNMEKNSPPGCHGFQAAVTIFELVQYIIGTNLRNKFHEHQK
ncbi:hypothetical protein DPMN_115003 [Dreissena polymorpha]|uniref:Uncharacterized protein n=1 Tax=Dreissena polymorpha TaxID=45954 RepID=A0A9D4KKF8_DREPO|nr:hypothetical protein DPMN_115003 [Dreissena polymorpha]